MGKIGVIINNIGTPKSPSRRHVGEYLTEFLMDPGVIRLPYLWRTLLVRGFIVPFRSKSSARKYKAIWTNEGSPLMVNTEKFARKLSSALGENFAVKIGMNYGTPSINDAIEQLRHCDDIIFCPMFPQFDHSTTQAAIDTFKAKAIDLKGRIHYLKPFYLENYFLEHFSRQLTTVQQNDYVLFSFHGLPKKYLNCNSSCGKMEFCTNCYKAQCYKTAELISHMARLAPEKWSVSFQSRLGPTEWLDPYTDKEIERLTESGVRSLHVASPAFVADCLETLEELGIESRQLFLSSGGEKFHLLSCPNDESKWVQGFADKIKGIFAPKE